MSDTDRLRQRLKALADPHRLRIVALCRQGEVSVGEVVQLLSQSQPRVSQHLKHLCDAGLLSRFRDGKRVYYRLPVRVPRELRQLLDLIPASDDQFDIDATRLKDMRGSEVAASPLEDDDPAELRALHQALVELAVAAPLGELLDIGCGRGQVLKLLGSRTTRAVGVDLDASARDLARAELLLAGLPHCSLRQGDMYNLPFADARFDTLVLDDVLPSAVDPVAAMAEAARVLKPQGRLLVLARIAGDAAAAFAENVAEWAESASLRIASPRRVPRASPRWLLSVATKTHRGQAAA